MFDSFEVHRFRGFSHFEIAGLDRVNLIAGANNVGKTALLEALFLHSGAPNLEIAMRLNGFRGFGSFKIELAPSAETPWANLFHRFDLAQDIRLISHEPKAPRVEFRLNAANAAEDLAQAGVPFPTLVIEPKSTSGPSDVGVGPLSIEAASFVLEGRLLVDGDRGRPHFLILDARGSGVFPAPPSPTRLAYFLPSYFRIPTDQDSERFSRLSVVGKQDTLLASLRILEPRLKSLSIAFASGTPAIHGDVGAGRLLPLAVMGEGLVRLTSLVLGIATSQHGIVLVDEVENGVHYSVMKQVWQALAQAAREFDVQLFATTHSLECIRSAHDSFAEGKYDLRVHRLQRNGEGVQAVTYDQEGLEGALTADFEVR